MLDAYLRRLDKEMEEHAKRSLLQPSEKDLFEYGQAVGLYRGLQLARTLYEDVLSEDDERRAKL